MDPKLFEVIPRSALLLEISGQYGPLPDKLPCGLAGCRTPHQKGFLVAFQEKNGSRGLGRVGHICGRNHFGTSWTEAKNAFDRKMHADQVDEARQRFLARMGNVLPRLDRLVPIVTEIASIRAALGPDVTRACTEAARGESGVIAIYSGRKLVHQHKLEGRSFWLTGGDLRHRVTSLQSDGSRFIDYLASPDADLREVERRLNGFSDVPQRWRAIRNCIESALATFAPKHVGQMLQVVNIIVRRQAEMARAHHSVWQLGVRLTGTSLEILERGGPRGRPPEVWEKGVDLARFCEFVQSELNALDIPWD